MEGRVEALEPVGADPSAGGSRQADLDREVEDQGQIRGERAKGKMMQRSEIGQWQPFAVSLISERRIGKSVGYHPDPLRQRRLDQPGDMITSRRHEQQGLADRIPALSGTFEKKPSDRFGVWRATGLTRPSRRDPGVLERGE